MSLRDNKSSIFQIVILIFSVLAIGLCFVNFFTIASKITDNNYYQMPHPVFRVQQDLQAEFIDRGQYYPSVIPVGALLIQVNDTTLYAQNTFQQCMGEHEGNEYIKLSVIIPENILDTLYFRARCNEIPDDFVEYFPLASVVVIVGKGGVSEIAGMKRGDLIVKINGKSFSESTEADLMLHNQNYGEIFNYEVLRGGETVNIAVKLARFGINFNYLVLFICGLIYIGVGMLFAIKRPNLVSARLSGMALILLGMVPAFGFIGTFYMMNSLEFARIAFLTIGYYIGIPLLLHSTYYFPNEIKVIINKKWIIIVPYAIGVAGAALSVIDMIANEGQSNIYIFSAAMLIITVFYLSVKFYHRSYIPKEIKRVMRAIRWAFYITMIILTGNWILTNLRGVSTGVYPNISIMLIPLAYLYTVGRYRLLDMDIRLRRNIQYIIVSALWKIFLLAVLLLTVYGIIELEVPIPNLHFTGTSVQLLENPLRHDLAEQYSELLAILLTFVASIIIWKINRKGQELLDSRFNRVKFDYKNASEKLRSIMSTKVSMEDLAKGICVQLGELIHVKQVGVIFFKDEDKVIGQKYYGVADHALKEFCAATGPKLIESVKQFKRGFRVDYLPEIIKSVFTECKFQYVIPISSNDKIVGVILVGEKLSESSFHNEDIEFLSSIAAQAATSIENVSLYEDLAKQERMKQELEIARRIQLASLPQEVPKISGLNISGISLPALEVGGDFYDYLDGSNDEVTIVVGDVSGKGTSAALYMSKAQGVMRTLHEFNLNPKDLLVRTNRLICKSLAKGLFISAIGARFNTKNKQVTLSRAGHLPLYLYRANIQKIEKVTPKGLALGMGKEKIFSGNLEEIIIKYHTGDVFLLITDGVLEARNSSNDDFDEHRLLSVFQNKAFNDSEQIRNSIVNAVQEFAGTAEQFDDLTVVVVKAV